MGGEVGGRGGPGAVADVDEEAGRGPDADARHRRQDLAVTLPKATRAQRWSPTADAGRWRAS